MGSTKDVQVTFEETWGAGHSVCRVKRCSRTPVAPIPRSHFIHHNFGSSLPYLVTLSTLAIPCFSCTRLFQSESQWVASSALNLPTGIIRGVDNEKSLGEGFFVAIASLLFKCFPSPSQWMRFFNYLVDLTFLLEQDLFSDCHHLKRCSIGPDLDRHERESIWVG